MKKILIAVDEQSVPSLRAILEKSGYEVAGNARFNEEAVEMSGRLAPDLALMDISLPGETDAFQACANIQSKWNIPVVFASSTAAPELLARIISAKPYGYALKPWQEVQLRLTIEIALRTKTEEKSSRDASKAKSKFLASVSHELRTPLHGILGYTQILQRDNTLTSRQKKAVDVIQRSGEHLLFLMNDLLDLGRIETDRIVLEKSNFYLPAFLKPLVEIIQLRAHAKRLHFRYRPGTNLPNWIHSDENRLRQILLNLLSNAVKFTDTGEVTLQVEYEMPTLKFSVKDTGPGIPPEQLRLILSSSYRPEGSRRRSEEGFGLGLLISQRLLAMMDSELQVASFPGKGSEFSFHLSISEKIVATTKSRERMWSILGIEEVCCKILVVDDQPESRTVIKDMLLLLCEKFEIMEAADGKEAVAKFREFKPDIVFMDIFMPEMDGFEATRRIRATLGRKKTSVIGISASVSEDVREKSLEAGCDDFVTKPLSLERLFEKLGNHLDLERIFQPAETRVRPTKKARAIPPGAEVELIYRLAMEGDVESIQRQAEKIKAAEAQYSAFADELINLAENFQVKKIKKFLAECMEKTDGA